MPVAFAFVFLIIAVGFLIPVSDESVHVIRQSALDQSVTENNEFADNSALNFRQLKINTTIGDIQRDSASNGVVFTGMQLVQKRIYENPTYVSALTNYSATWPVPAAAMQTLLNQAHGTVPNYTVRAEPVRYGDRAIQRWMLRIDALRFAEWKLVDQAWLDTRFGPAGAGFSRWVALVDVESTETFWKDAVGLNGRPFDGAPPCVKCTNPARPTLGATLAAVRFRRTIEIPVCFGLPGVASPGPCNDPRFSYTTALGFNGNACAPPDCRNFVVAGENGCGNDPFNYGFELIQQ